ncbi:MAG: hypothetical protein ACR2P3_09180, partial [Geminicoccaceae bacterium]
FSMTTSELSVEGLERTRNLIEGRITGVQAISEQTGIEDTTVATVLEALSNLHLSSEISRHLRKYGYNDETAFAAEVGVKRIAMLLVIQHAIPHPVETGAGDEVSGDD